MKNRTIQGLAGVVLCAIGFWLAYPKKYQQRTYLVDARGCHLMTDIVEPKSSTPQGAVVLLHGISANKKIMAYVAEGFAAQGLRVFVPDLPGHGRTVGPFSFARAEQCAESLVHELIARGLVEPQRAVLAGHSMGGAIALRVASRVRVAGVIAISPAPMRHVPGLSPEMIPFPDLEKLPSNSLVMSGAWEPGSVRAAARELLSTPADDASQYVVVPHATHVSILFDSQATRRTQEWASRVLHLELQAALPSHRGVAGYFVGFAGLLFLVGPFLRETLQQKQKKTDGPTGEQAVGVSKARALLELAMISLGVVAVLHYWNPLTALHLFEGDYFAGFLLLVGIGLIVLHWNPLYEFRGEKHIGAGTAKSRAFPLLASTFAGLVVLLLFSACFDLAFTEAWLTAPRWARFPAFFIAVLPYHAAEEFLLGPAHQEKKWRRLITAVTFRFVAWVALLAGIFYLHSGEILLVLLAPYFALFCLLQRRGMDIVREVTASPAAAALFGAILFAGFCLVVFPTT
jgi:pimeloyl-ACP methyl ester carboxylesterase